MEGGGTYIKVDLSHSLENRPKLGKIKKSKYPERQCPIRQLVRF